MVEGKWHKKNRKALISRYKQEGYMVESSHENKVIGLYRGQPSRSTFLSDADIILFKDKAIVKIVEVKDRDITPKVMAGIVSITDICDICKIDNKLYKLKDIELIIAYKKQKAKSRKAEQFRIIKDCIKLNGCLKKINFFEIDEE
jgi:hypothetical protein